MAKHNKKRAFRYVMFALACTAAFSVSGITSACSSNQTDETDDKTTSREDTQLLKNGNFEFFEVPDKKEDGNAPVYLINTPDNWSHGGSSSYVASGIIGTSAKDWAALTASDLAGKLDYNNALDADDSNYKDDYVDYNGLTSNDLLYKDVHAALNFEEDDEEDGEEVTDPRTEFIENPYTRFGEIKSDSNGLYYTDSDGKRVDVYEDTDEDSKTYGDYFLDEELKQPFSHVLMLHNYATEHNGIAQNYSSIDVELPANTAAEISVWVKTSYLLFNQGSTVSQDRGASISVTQSVGSSTLDDFSITCINTEKLLGGKSGDNNGWVEYTVYVNACDFAPSTITIKLGLGETDKPVEGYAFFDDVTVTKFASLSDANCSYTANADKIGNATCTLTSDESEKIFPADVYERTSSEGTHTDKRYSENYYYYIDLASTKGYNPVSFNGVDNFKAGLTVDGDKYASAKVFDGKTINITPAQLDANVKLPADFTALDTSDDLLAYVTAGHSFTANETAYYSKLNEELKIATSLPNVSGNTQNNLLVLLSAHGAAYTASFDMTIDGDGDGYKIISFWVKTSDMKGGAAATVTVTEKDNKENTASISIDTTGVVTDIDDEHEDIYNGWVQYFLFVENDTDDTAEYTVEFAFGNTTIKDTTASSYNYGWAALANLQYLDVDEDTFAYTSGGTNSASLTISKEDEKKNSVFDEAYGNQAHEIENGIVNPNNYTGVNGASSAIVNNGQLSFPFDDDINPTAGLINADHVENYYDQLWYQDILASFNASSLNALDSWREVFGKISVQPLIIVNNLRERYIADKGATKDNYTNYYIKNEDGDFELVSSLEEVPDYDEATTYYSRNQVLNYGYISENKTVSSDSYETVSVKVKVSAGAVAYVYLVDTSAGKNVLSFTAPSYSFYYDEDGNVIKEQLDDKATIDQKRANVLYTLRDDGLYEDKDGNLRANVYNYTKVYKANIAYYDKDGNKLSLEDVVDGNTYYTEDGKIANHFLATTDGVKLYEFIDGKYYYIVSGVTQTAEVLPFETEYARYDYSDMPEDYFVVIDGNDPEVAGKWITVNFVIHTGSESKSYRLELWSGERDQLTTDGNDEGGTVIFDYSYASVTSDDLRDEYESNIIAAYKKLLAANGKLDDNAIASSEENIGYYEELAKGIAIDYSNPDYSILSNYKAHYYTFSLYDSANFQPFNKDVADENSTGYDYNVSDWSESLAYLSVKDFDEENETYAYSVFVDYSTTDQSITLGTDTEDEDTDEDEDKDSSSVWLLVSSILLVIALLFAMLAIFVKDALKKMRRKKVLGKNNYNHNRTNRYMRKLHLKKEEFEETEAPVNEAQPVDEPAEAEQPSEEADTPAETEQPSDGETDG